MSPEENVVKAKENLQRALGDRFVDYMQSMKKWFAGKTTKQEFDREARDIVSPRYVPLHNEFLLCIISKCNNFSSLAIDAANRCVLPTTALAHTSSSSSSSSAAAAAAAAPPGATLSAAVAATTGKSKSKKLKTTASTTTTSDTTSATATNSNHHSGGNGGKHGGVSYHQRFVPVDPIKHAPSILCASLEAAASQQQQQQHDFRLEFCARERSLPYARMIHGRMLLGAIDLNLQLVDAKACFLLAEATIWMLKNMVTRLIARSKFRHKLRALSSLERYTSAHVSDERVLANQRRRLNTATANAGFHVDPAALMRKVRHHPDRMDDDNDDDTDETMQRSQEAEEEEEEEEDDDERRELAELANDLNNCLVAPVRKLPITLFDLKQLLQDNKASLMPSHSVYTMNMERAICKLTYDIDEQDGDSDDDHDDGGDDCDGQKTLAGTSSP